MNVKTLSDSALLLTLGDAIDPRVNRRVHALAARLAAHPLAGVSECVPAYASLTAHYDPLLVGESQVAEWLRREAAGADEEASRGSRRVEVPVRYGGEAGPDLPDVAGLCGLSPAEVVRIHTASEYRVYMMGFTPGFPYMGLLDERLRVPRLASPRARVPAGTVAIAAAQTGIYPLDSPGGWRLIGRTDLALLDPTREPPFLFMPGDCVRFCEEELITDRAQRDTKDLMDARPKTT